MPQTVSKPNPRTILTNTPSSNINRISILQERPLLTTF